MSPKEKIQNYVKGMPSLFKDASKYIKVLFDEEAQGIVEDTGGVTGLIIRFFGKGWVDKRTLNDNYFLPVTIFAPR